MQYRYEHIANLFDQDGDMVSLFECRICFALVNNMDSHTEAVHSETTKPSDGAEQ